MNNDKLEAFMETLKRAKESQKVQPIAKKPIDSEALEKFRARIQEMINKAKEAKCE